MFGKWLFALLAPLALGGHVERLQRAGRAAGRRPDLGRRRLSAARPGGWSRSAKSRSAASSTGVSDGTLVGGGVGAAGGAIAGAAIGGSAGSAILGGVLGAVGGAIAGTAIDRNSTRQGIEVTVQKDDGTSVVIAQRDDGDVQMGDRVIIVYDRNGVARVVRDTGRRRDY